MEKNNNNTHIIQTNYLNLTILTPSKGLWFLWFLFVWLN